MESQASYLLNAVCALHELGTSIEFKKSGEHGAYLLRHLELPGFTRAQKILLAEWVRRYRDTLCSLPEQHALSAQSANRLLRILRLAVILCHRRNEAEQPPYQLNVSGEQLKLTLPRVWLEANPLSRSELEQEAHRQSDLGWPLQIIENE